MAHAYDNNKATLARARDAAGRDLPITVPAGSTLLICAITVDALVARTGGAPTCGSGSYTFTQADQNRYYASTGETISELWYLLNPPSGSVTIHIPDDNNKYFSADAASFTAGTGKYSVLRGANGTSNESTNPTCPGITSCVAGDAAIATSGDGAATYAPSARTGISLYEVDDGGYGHATQYFIVTGSGTLTMSWTFGTSSTWGAVVAVFQEWPQNMTIGTGGSPVAQTAKGTESLAAAVSAQTTLSPSVSQSAKLTEALGVSVLDPVVESLSIQVSQSAKSTDYTPTPLYQIVGISDNAAASVAAQPALEISDADAVKATEVDNISLSSPIILESSISQSAKATETVGIDSTIIDLPAQIAQSAKLTEVLELSVSSQPDFLAQIAQSAKLTEALESAVSSQIDLSPQTAQSAKLTEALESSVSSQVDLSAQIAQSAKLTEAIGIDSALIDLTASISDNAKISEIQEVNLEGILPDLHANSSDFAHAVDYISQPLYQAIGLSDSLQVQIETGLNDILVSSPVNSVRMTEALESAISSQVDLLIQGNEIATISDDAALTISDQLTLSAAAADIVRITEVQTANVEGLLADLNIIDTETVRVMDSPGVTIENPITLSPTANQAANLTEDRIVSISVQQDQNISLIDAAKAIETIAATVSDQIALSLQADETARASDNAALAISDQLALSAAAGDIVRITEVQITNVEGMLADLNVLDTETVRVMDSPGVTVEVPITLSPTANQAASLTEDRTVSISAQQDQNISLTEAAKATETTAAALSDQTAIAPSVSQSFKATEDETITVTSQVPINANIADSAEIAEVLMAETEEFPAIEITSPAEMIRATESKTVSLLAQLAVELAAIDSVAIVDIPNGAKQEATPLTPQAAELVLISELLAGEISAPITLNSEITDHIRATDRITALVRSLVSIIDIEVDVRINQPGIFSSTGDCAVPIIRNIPSINIMGGNVGILSMISGSHHIRIEDSESIGATEMIAAEVI